MMICQTGDEIMIALCVLGVFAFLATTVLIICLVHSGNISRAEEARERKEKMNNLKTNLAKTENKDNE